MKKTRLVLLLMIVLTLFSVTPALAATQTVTWTGQGLTTDEQGALLVEHLLCGEANGAPTNAPYLLWVLTSSHPDDAQISGPWGTAPMS
ncbi:MAG: hypothetical protein ACRC1H_03275, partial [Caldilineaceae bacterium]